MDREQMAVEKAKLEIENIGGIGESTVELTPGVTLLAGRNATNRTSLLQALMAALGSENVSLKGDADEGSVELAIGDRTWTRRLRREDGTIVTEGEPYLDDATLADLFAFLLESNEARQAIARAEDLREVIMRPVDTAAIEADIERLADERERIGDQIEELDALERRLPELEDQRNELEAQVEEARAELESVEADVEEHDASVDEEREEQAELDETIEELGDVRGQLETVRRRLDSERESVDALENERDELEAELEDLQDVSDDRIEGIGAEVQRLRNQIDAIESTLGELQTVIQFNEDVLDGEFDLFGELRADDEQGAVTDRLLDEDGEVVCWTCGSEVDTAQIESMVDRIREIHAERMDERNALDAEIDELETERIELRERRRQHEQLATRLDRVVEEIDERGDRVEELEERRSELAAEVDRLETEVEELRSDDQNELLDLHKEANRLQVEVERRQADLQAVEEEIDELEAQVAEREQLETQREELQEEIEYLRTRVERLEQQAIEEFNDHMDAVLDILEYQNIERIWIERTQREVREGRRTVTKGHFDLHVVRATESDTVYEDTVEHLSESEREVTGLVFALAGYLAHEVYEELPFILLDSVEALDADRIAAIVEYLNGFADFLVAALLESDAAALDDDYKRITDI